MKTTVRRWLSAVTTNRTHAIALGVASLAVTGVVAGAASVAGATPETPAAVVANQATSGHTVAGADSADAAAKKATAQKAVAEQKAAAQKAAAQKAAAQKAAAQKKAAAAKKVAARTWVEHKFQLQTTYYNCGPSATRVALSAHGKVYSESRIGRMLGTTTNGTNSAYDITRVLNSELGKGRYKTVEIGGRKATAKQVAQLKADIIAATSKGDPVVANVVGAVTDTNGHVHSYPGGHYIPVIGYTDSGNTVRIADTADTVGSPYYKLSVKDLANWIASRGYSA